MANNEKEILLKVRGAKTYFAIKKGLMKRTVGYVKAVVNTCDTEYQEECAKLRINSEWGFEASRIQIQGTPYYDATYWNFIRFRCGPYDWLMKDGELYQIYE